MKRMDFDLFRLEDRVLFEAAAVAEIVEAAEAVQENPNANVNEAEKQAQEERDSLKNAPPENPAGQAGQNEGDAQRDPAEAADIDAQVEQLIQGEIPATDGAGDVMLPELGDLSSAVLEADESGNLVDALIVPSDAMISCGRELVVINGTVPDQDAILAALKPNQEVLVLEDGNGLSELNEYLDAHDGKYDAIHLVTHGNEGYLSINGEIINAENFDVAEWADVGEHLTDDGDILLYGCDTAATAEGRLLVDHIAEASGADVAASTDATGISGDWKLEYHHGTIDSTEISVENFEHNLTNYTVTNLNDSGTGSLRWAVEQANANTGTDEITFSTNGTIKLESRIIVNDSTNILGNGVENTILDGQDKTGLLQINGSTAVNVRISNIAFQNASDSRGGAIRNSGTLDISNTLFLNNTSSIVASDGGGAIWNNGLLYITNSTFDSNSAAGGGGAVCNWGSLRVFNTTFSNNLSASSSYSKGGAIYLANYGTSAFIVNSILVGNKVNDNANDLSIYGGNVYAYYSLLGSVDGALKTQVEVESNVTVDQVFSEIDSRNNPVLNSDGTFHVKANGLADQRGVFVWKNGENFAYSLTPTSERYSIGGSVSDTILVEIDQLGRSRKSPTSIGAYDLNAGEAQSLIVTTTRDVVDSTDGYTSLREAMNYAAGLNGSQTISFNITDPDYAHGSADYLVIESALPTISKSLAINGTNVATGNDVTISVADRGCFTDGSVNENGSEFRVFTIKAGDVTLSHLNLIGGRIDQLTGTERYGAAVFGNGSSCNITIDHVNASGGAARTGGALAFTNINSVKIYNSVFEENRAAWGEQCIWRHYQL